MMGFLRVLLAVAAQLVGLFGGSMLAQRIPYNPALVGALMMWGAAMVQRRTGGFARNVARGAALAGGVRAWRGVVGYVDHSNILGPAEAWTVRPAAMLLNQGRSL